MKSSLANDAWRISGACVILLLVVLLAAAACVLVPAKAFALEAGESEGVAFGTLGELDLLSYDEARFAVSECLSYEDAVHALMEGMAAHEDFIAITLETGSDTSGLWIDLVEDALLEDGNPYHGDYLRCSLGFVDASCSKVPASKPGRYIATFVFELNYWETAGQQRLLFEKADELILGLDLDGKSDYQKARAIYDFICSNVSYGSSSLPQGQPYLQQTAYAALVHGQAVCEGYAALFDLLAAKAGLSSRVIVGDAGGSHAWNIVKIDGLYYNVDSTWDAGHRPDGYRYFLKSDADFSDHLRGGEEVDDLWFENYRSDEFYAAHPMASTSYIPKAGVEGSLVHDGFAYVVRGGKATIESYQGSATDVIVPSRVGSYPSYPVIAIAESAFSGNDALKSVVIPEGVATIGSAAFRDCASLTSVVIPEGVQDIPYLAFSGCASLRSVSIPLSTLYIEGYAFANCTSLERLDIPRGVWALGTSAFSGCTSMKEVLVPRSVEDFGRNLFSGLPRGSVVRVAEQWQYDELSGNAKYLDAEKTAIELVSAVEVPIDVPPFEEGLVYTGAEQGAVASGAGYRVHGEAVGVDAREYYVQITPLPGYSWSDGSIETLFMPWSIAPVSLRIVDGLEIPDRVYEGFPARPELELSFNGVRLIEGEDYTVSFRDNAEVGAAAAVLTGLGNYSGSVTVSFDIVPPPAAIWEGFPDVAREVNKAGGPEKVWYVADGWLDYVVNAGLMGGYASNGYFGPYDNITRGQVAVILFRSECAENPALIEEFGSTTDPAKYAQTVEFKDEKPNEYYTAAINWAKAVGIMTGDAGTNYTTVRPNDLVARQELCLMLARYANGGTVPSTELDPAKAQGIKGMGKIADWARDGVYWAVNNGVIGGVSNGDGTFSMDPTGKTWRSAAAKMFTVTMRDVL